jgi:flagellar motor switch protein FliN
MSELSPNTVSDKPTVPQFGTSGEAASPTVGFSQSEPGSQSLRQPVADSSRLSGKREFPPFTRSLLRVRVPIVVTLAQKKQTLGRILEIGPGQIIQFDKSCEEMLDLEASNCKIASGEAVKVGDKFGIRITSIVPPEERFLPVRKD